MTVTIYHNPRCSKSRQTLDLIQASGVEYIIHLYLEDRLNEADLNRLLDKLNFTSPRDIMRIKEGLYRELGLKSEESHSVLIQAMIDNPRLIERPIVEDKTRAILGRPPENVQILLKD